MDEHQATQRLATTKPAMKTREFNALASLMDTKATKSKIKEATKAMLTVICDGRFANFRLQLAMRHGLL
eukprot:10706292-Lingulodinium_polyedra.AAC.1